MSVIPLNIITTYPVRWDKYKVLRDFVQNFYDSVPTEKWKSVFSYSFENNILTMSIADIIFNYEWLLHIGASTKTAAHATAGYFGEGFKIASLCAFRDFGWNIHMASGEWELDVTSVDHTIDMQKMKMLAYTVSKKDFENRSVLTLSILDDRDYKLFLNVLISFYYPENSLLGKEIWNSPQFGAVYTRSSMKIPNYLPHTYNCGTKGAIFCKYQMLGTNPFNLVVCLHNYDQRDRERNTLYQSDVINIFEKIASYIDALGAMFVLEEMRRFWNSYPKGYFDIHSWSKTVDTLIKKISRNITIKTTFVQKYPNILYLPRIHSIREQNMRSQARSWLKDQNRKYLLCKDTFSLLGYNSLEEECRKHGGFVKDDSVNNETEAACFKLLEDIIYVLFKDFFQIENNMPARKVIRNVTAIYAGMAVLHKANITKVNSEGYIIKKYISAIYLKYYLLAKNMFYSALSTYIHEMCHMFGGDASANFSLALTEAMTILLQNHKIIEFYRKKWEALFDETAPPALSADQAAAATSGDDHE